MLMPAHVGWMQFALCKEGLFRLNSNLDNRNSGEEHYNKANHKIWSCMLLYQGKRRQYEISVAHSGINGNPSNANGTSIFIIH